MSDEFDRLGAETPATPIDDKVVSLETEIAKLKAKRNEDRFCFLVGLIILCDAYVFMKMPSWGGPIAILILESVVLFVAARKMEIEDLTVITDKLIAAVGRHPR